QAPPAEEVRRVLVEAGAVRFGEFILTSGRKSDVYIDVKKAWTEPARLDLIARALAARVAPGEQGSPDGARGRAARRRNVPAGRPADDRHPQGRRSTGLANASKERIPPGARVLLIEDTATTGGSLVQSIEILRAAGALVDRALVVVDREEGARERLAELGVHLEALTTLSELRGAPA
ncbi:orotate phosphoribosyltransferase, partial [mine drainage metagenome]